ncbi:MAG: DNA polymerase I [Candidatus Fibromonas sp.]|nr:DNA polymerase I [Candidatus Fibromonas sp.]
MHRLFLVDSSALAFRMYYAYMKNPLRNSKGQLVSLLHGYWGAILRILKSHQPEYFAIVRDVSRKTFRNDIYPEYKANRPPMPPEMAEQLPYLNETMEKSGIPVLEQEGFEADDIMASVAKFASKENCFVFLVTKDKDMAQIINDKIHLYQIEKGAKGLDFGAEHVREKFGIEPEQMRDYLALVGDASDNIPGVARIGPKSAAELLKKFGDLESIYGNLEKLPKTKQEILRAGKDSAFLSRELATLQYKHDFGYSLKDLRYEGLRRDELYKLFNDYEVPSLIPLLPSIDESPSIFSYLLAKKKEEKVFVDSIETLQKMEEDLKPAETLAFMISETGIVYISKDEYVFYELLQDLTLYKEWLYDLFKNRDLEIVFYNAKQAFHFLEPIVEILPQGKVRDVLLAKWLLRPSANHGYAPENSMVLLAKWKEIRDELRNKNLFDFFESEEIPLIKCLYEMEKNGISIDNGTLATLNAEFQKRLADYESQVFEIAEEHFNLASPKQLSHILYEKLKLPVLKKSAKKGPSTDAETLEMLSECAEPNPILSPIMNWRELQKLQNGYTEALPKLVSPKTNRIHTTFLPWGTVTGRLSSTNPNLQNIPVRSEDGRRIRAAFVPSQKNWRMISVDYSQIELRMLAHLSGDKQLTNAFLHNQDIHNITAERIFGTSEISKDMRAAAKTVNFGVIYGMSAFRLAKDLHISRTQALEFINGYFSLYGDVKEYFDSLVEFARENGYVETIARRRRYLPELRSSEHQERAMAERMAMNSPIQGSAADLILEAMLRLHKRIREENLPLKMLLQVHDELVFECEGGSAEKLATMIKNEMENAIMLKVPIVANAGIGNNWLEAHA